MSPAGEALAMLPPSVPRFWICAAPIVAAASARAGQELGDRARAADLGVGGQRAEDQGAAVDADAAQLVQRHRSRTRSGGVAELAGDLDHQVGAAGDGAMP